jgi:hypothetical protein
MNARTFCEKTSFYLMVTVNVQNCTFKINSLDKKDKEQTIKYLVKSPRTFMYSTKKT